MKPRHIVLGAALALAAGLVVFGDNAPEGALAEPVERARPALAGSPAVSRAVSPAASATESATESATASAAASAAAPRVAARPDAAVVIARLTPRADLIDGERFGQAPAPLFTRQDWTPPPPPASTATPPAPPPSAPPLPFTYVGKSLQDGVWEIYLARGERSYLVRAGATIDNTWRVEAIRPPVLTLTYLPLGQSQQLTIGVFD